MKKKVFGRRLQRDTKERKALFKSLTRELILCDGIKTTEAKAKSVKGSIEKLITKARDNASETKRMLSGVYEEKVITRLVDNIAPRFVGRPGGYTRIVRLGNRVQDNAPMVLLELVEGEKKVEKAVPTAAEAPKKVEKKTKVVKTTVKKETKKETAKK